VSDPAAKKSDSNRQAAMRFILLLGLVSLFGDITYEGARSITGPFLALLGASATVVGVVAGLGELIGYSLRLFTGFVTEKTGRYWLIALCGYIINFVSIPLLSIAGSWPAAASLMIAERFGKAVRTPARDSMLSHATTQVGTGWGFGIHEAMDSTGSLIGPLIIAGILFWHTGAYRTGFGILFIPALLALGMLLTARIIYPNPREFEKVSTKPRPDHLTSVFWLYLAATALIAAGFADFALIAYHFKKLALVADAVIPLMYALAMGVNGIAALALGRIYDRIGINTLLITTLLSTLFAPLVFLGSVQLAVLGMVVWGIGMAAQQSVLRAAICEITACDKRGSAYGIFNAGYGIAWFLGSALMGVLYDHSIMALVIFSVLIQLAAIPVLLVTRSRVAWQP